LAPLNNGAPWPRGVGQILPLNFDTLSRGMSRTSDAPWCATAKCAKFLLLLSVPNFKSMPRLTSGATATLYIVVAHQNYSAPLLAILWLDFLVVHSWCCDVILKLQKGHGQIFVGARIVLFTT
jgi:hypothetical protein